MPYLRRHRTALVLGGLSVLLTASFQVWVPSLVRRAVDHVQAGVTRTDLAHDAGLILLAVVLQGLFLYTMRMTLIRTSRRMEYELRNDLFDHLARLPAGVYRARKVGDLMSRATNDLDAVRDLLGPGIMYSANTATTFVMAVATRAKAMIATRSSGCAAVRASMPRLSSCGPASWNRLVTQPSATIGQSSMPR